MRASERDKQVVIVASRDEVRRMAGVMAEGLSLLGRAEFYMRTGCAKSNVEELVGLLQDVAEGVTSEFVIDVTAGVEIEENPRRPRL